MKCKNCGAELSLINGSYTCNYCGSSFPAEELLPKATAPQAKEFRIVGGVLLAYMGNQSRVAIPDGTMAIGKDAFKNNLSVREVIFSKTVTQIDNNAFEGCTNLTEIVDYSNVSKYGDECFKGSGLTNVMIGPNVVFLGNGCFSRMPDLESVRFCPDVNLKLNHTFAYCPKLAEVEEETYHFFPSLHKTIELRNNPQNQKPTWGDAFIGTPYIRIIMDQYMKLYRQGVCPECGGRIKKRLFHAKCNNCNIDFNN